LQIRDHPTVEVLILFEAIRRVVARRRSLGDIVATLTADTTPYLSCDECFGQICAHVDRLAADPRHRYPALQKHLHACSACAEEAAAILELIRSDAARGSSTLL
jgi:hypothetical protein